MNFLKKNEKKPGAFEVVFFTEWVNKFVQDLISHEI